MASLDVNVKENGATVESITIKVDSIVSIKSMDSGNDTEVTLADGRKLLVDTAFATVKAAL